MNPREDQPRILIVDDNPNIHRDFSLVFAHDVKGAEFDAEEETLFNEAPGQRPVRNLFELDHALSGMEGVERVTRAVADGRRYQMAFVDIRMPGIDGVETIARLWQVDPAVQVVICTAYSDYSQEDLAGRLGQTDKLLVLKKPFDEIEVLQLAYTLTAKWFLARQAELKLEQMELLVSQRTRKVLDLQRRESERLHEEDAIRLRFFNYFTREFRTPLTLILNPLDALVNAGKLDREQQEVIQRNAGRLLHMVDHLNTFPMLEVGEQKPRLMPGHLPGVVRGVVLLFHPLASQQDIRLELMEAGEPRRVVFDAGQVENALFCLLSNALKDTPANGSVSVRLGFEGASAEVVIEDSGRGLSPGLMARFACAEPAMEISSPVTAGEDFLWLGYARRLVELQGGKLTATSRAAGGTCVRISLPTTGGADVSVLPAPVDPEPEEELPADDEESTARLPIILVVESNPDLCRHLAGGLSGQYRVLQAENGARGVEKARKIIPDLAIVDFDNPKLNGLELCRQLKSDPMTSHVPVMLLTSDVTDHGQLEALEAGVDDCIAKPFRLPLLKARVDNLLATRRRLLERLNQMSSLHPRDIAASQPDARFLQRATQIVDESIADCVFGIGELAQKLGVSRRQLFRKFEALTNATPNQFIRSFRLKRAAQLLKNTPMTVTEVTYAVGFSDLKHFRMVFKEEFGILPGDYGGTGDKQEGA